jgi:multimeric flavodoxin WrbA
MILAAEKIATIEPIDVSDFKGQKLLVAIDLDSIGENAWLMNWIRERREESEEPFEGCKVIFLINSPALIYSKEMAKRLIFLFNILGARVPGQPLVEAIENLENMRKWAQYSDTTREEALYGRVQDLVLRLTESKHKQIEKPRLLVLHANSNEKTSNTHQLWEAVRKHLTIDYDVIHVEDGTVLDCRGCAYDTCAYYAKQNSCFYGGVMVKEILPAIEEADAVLWLLPNYNDSISAKLMAVINRLTVLYRKQPLLDKNLYAIVVSGNSGSDSVVKQLIGALNINKGFHLPPGFYLDAIASQPEEIVEHPLFEEMSRLFAQKINSTSHYIG